MLFMSIQLRLSASVCTIEGLDVDKGEAFTAHQKALHIKVVAGISDAAC